MVIKGKPVNRGGDFSLKVPCEYIVRVTICPLSGCIGCVVTVTVNFGKRQHFNVICRKHLSDIGNEKCLVLIVFVFL